METDLTKAGKAGEAAAVGAAIQKLSEEFTKGAYVNVEWRGTWCEAQVLEAKDGKWKIRYDGYGEEWDEWVDTTRIRARAAPPPGMTTDCAAMW